MPRAKTQAERDAKHAAAVAAGMARPKSPDHAPWTSADGAKPGDAIAMKYGGFSLAVYGPRADELFAQYMADADFPEYAKTSMAQPLLRRLCGVRVRIALWEAMSDEQGEAAAVEVSKTTERVTGSMEAGTFKRKAVTRKSMPAEETYRRWVTIEMNLCEKLGLTPMARAKLGKDVSSTAVNLSQIYAEDEAGD